MVSNDDSFNRINCLQESLEAKEMALAAQHQTIVRQETRLRRLRDSVFLLRQQVAELTEMLEAHFIPVGNEELRFLPPVDEVLESTWSYNGVTKETVAKRIKQDDENFDDIQTKPSTSPPRSRPQSRAAKLYNKLNLNPKNLDLASHRENMKSIRPPTGVMSTKGNTSQKTTKTANGNSNPKLTKLKDVTDRLLPSMPEPSKTMSTLSVPGTNDADVLNNAMANFMGPEKLSKKSLYSLECSKMLNSIVNCQIVKDDSQSILRFLAGEESRSVLQDFISHSVNEAVAFYLVCKNVGLHNDVGRFLPQWLRILLDVVECERGTVFYFDEERGELFSRCVSGQLDTPIRLGPKQGIVGRVFTTGLAMRIDDAYTHPLFNPAVDKRTNYRTRNILCVPIKLGSQVVGALQLLNKRRGSFTDSDMNLLRLSTSMIAPGLSPPALHTVMRAAFSREREAMKSILNQKRKALLAPLNSEVMKAVAQVLDCELCMMFVLVADGTLLSSTYFALDDDGPFNQFTGDLAGRQSQIKLNARHSSIGSGADFRSQGNSSNNNRKKAEMQQYNIEIPADRGLLGHCVRSGAFVTIQDSNTDPRFNKVIEHVHVPINFLIRSTLIAPVFLPDRAGGMADGPVAVLQIFNRKGGGGFSQQDEMRLAAISNLVGSVLQVCHSSDDALVSSSLSERVFQTLHVASIVFNSTGLCIKVNSEAKRLFNLYGVSVVGDSNDNLSRVDSSSADYLSAIDVGTVGQPIQLIFKGANADLLSLWTRVVLTRSSVSQTQVPIYNSTSGGFQSYAENGVNNLGGVSNGGGGDLRDVIAHPILCEGDIIGVVFTFSPCRLNGADSDSAYESVRDEHETQIQPDKERPSTNNRHQSNNMNFYETMNSGAMYDTIHPFGSNEEQQQHNNHLSRGSDNINSRLQTKLSLPINSISTNAAAMLTIDEEEDLNPMNKQSEIHTVSPGFTSGPTPSARSSRGGRGRDTERRRSSIGSLKI